MKLSDFDFDLPERLIATRPAKPRSASRLLVSDGTIRDAHMHDLPEFLRPGDLLVLNDTKVIPARLSGTRTRQTPQGEAVARVEVTLLEPAGDGAWHALAKPLRKLRAGEVVRFGDALSAAVESLEDQGLILRFDAQGAAFDAALARVGAMPLPPYIAAKRAPDAQDKNDYQTVWARHSGAVAAPTASLHFDQPLLDRLRDMGVQFVHVTLHVGAGTFLPVKVEDVATHKMHAEYGEVTAEAAAAINAARAEGRRVIPVGTTALRLIESAATDGKVRPFAQPTDIFIYPGYQFRVTDALITNFHLPKSTLLMLVSALIGREKVRQIYQHAVTENYRFFSYGDASLLIPAREKGAD
ncbi:MAG: tRNA preQ1(34) S-adenosylmethionine ribosyltransferase-isomerase QueA [Paracoccus sp. (in: a-proteobacteria)]|uniref:tRNA preQ1(34) S-adenosylmethionine ribosyltransferase-isomerase QueA n=1 Tax=Paracoccus sp. TaxID=267 RepID=UPI0026DECEA4|nr:tRNA preQ1(34) S-adenosylmethionine ribosyltransferase-isomerase QueA [Paracoccus sp. (in: a-proteobacteria)]MDO5622507.1 tRNA preQ1(34) S-adenosylmethionine ribosyltransferase-isomerase QueA [Paracoccus sp. (in: a-proteobacteria)]